MRNKDTLSQDQTTGQLNLPEKKSRLERLEQRIAELENQRKALLSRENYKKRKLRTRKLIQIGAIAIKYLDCPNDIEPTEFEQVIKNALESPPTP